MNRRCLQIFLGVFCLLCIVCVNAHDSYSYNYATRSNGFTGGGGTSTSNSYLTSGTIGQLTVGTTSSSSYINQAGFWNPAILKSSTPPATAPGTPTITQVSTGNGTATVSFTAPANNGGSAITGYTVTATPTSGSPITATGSGSPIAITALTNGTSYTFTVTATNSTGTSAASTASTPAIPGNSPRIQLPKTGQTSCWDANGNLLASCTGTGQDGNILSGLAWPNPRFTNPDGTIPVTSTIIADQLTGLQWVKDADSTTYASCTGGSMAWQNALNYVACLNSNNYLGHSDWRMPNINEMLSLINEQTTSLNTLTTIGFTNVNYWGYWTSTTSPVQNAAAQTLIFNTNTTYMGFNSKTTTQFPVIPVRTGTSSTLPQTGQTGCWDVNGNAIACTGTGQDGDTQAGLSWPNPRLTNLDLTTPVSGSTVFDRLTGLQWVQDGSTPSFASCAGGPMNWQNGLNYIACLNANNYLGYNDWRMPNITELVSLLNSQQNGISWLNSLGFSNIVGGGSGGGGAYWTSDTVAVASSTTAALGLNVSAELVEAKNKVTSSGYTLPVRGGLVAPGSPTITQVATGMGTATVTFAAPANTGGSAITGYTVTSIPPGGVDQNAGTASLTHVITGLTNGTSYTFTVTATNSTGTSVASTASNPAIPGNSPRVQLPQTGQTGCWDANGNLLASCTGTGQDGNTQVGVAWPDPRFTNPDGSAPVISTIVVDQLTGLQWARDASVPSYGACNGGALAWPNALTYVACLNQNLYLGHNDWRLPNMNEMASLINKQVPDSSAWLNSLGFINAQPTYYWTSTNGAVHGVNAQSVYMTGNAINQSSKINQYLVIPVRTGLFNTIPKTGQTGCWDVNGNSIACTGTGQDGDTLTGMSWPNPRFTNLDLSTPINGSIVYDRLTGLQWTQDGSTPSVVSCSGGLLSWQNAINYVVCLNTNNYLGYNDWRLPNVNELVSLLNSQQSTNPWLMSNGFINITDGPGIGNYWSSDTYVLNSRNACFMNFGANFLNNQSKTGTHYTLPVRGGLIVPGTPTITSVTTNNGTATVSFTAPTANGGTAVTGYTVTAKSNGHIVSTQGGTNSPITVTGLANNGATYSIFVSATNSSGSGKAAIATATITAQASVNGRCGSANGETFTQTPTTNLCSSGNATAVSGTGPQHWSCTGSGAGLTANCTSYFTTNVAAPITTIAPAGGSYTTGSVLVTLTCSNSAATIYYTTNGSSPTVLSPVYSTPITVTGNETINYFSVDPVGNAEPVRTATYSVTAGGPPTVDVALVKSGTVYTVLSSIGGATPTPVVTNTTTATFTDTSTLPPNTIVQYTVVSDTDPTQTILMTIHTPMYNGWNIIGVPYSTTGVNPATFFGSPVSAIYLWQPSGATPESSNSVLGSYTTVSTIAPGNGYFVQAADKSTILVYSGNPGPSSATVTLNPGWTMIANPQLTNMTNIGANWLIDGNPLSTAITNNQIGGGLYWWNGTTYNSWTIMGDNPQVEPWKGYWIVNIDLSPHTLIIQTLLGPAIAPAVP